MKDVGKVVWITGLAGAGKTTIGNAVKKKLKDKGEKRVVFLDGDELRSLFGNNIGHSYEKRKELGGLYQRLCKMLSEQGISVFCCTIGLIESVRKWNYQNIDKFMEVYINTPMPVLEQRDKKGLYSGAKKGITKDVLGVDIPAEPPLNPEMEIVNDDFTKIDYYADLIIEKYSNW